MTDLRREQAIILRGQGKSIKDIAKQLHAAQSSVSIWVRNVTLTEEHIIALRNKSHTPEAVELRRQARLASEDSKRSKAIAEAQQSLGDISARELQLIGTALYWAEGGKTKRMVRFSNGDPNMIRLMMRYFREICQVPQEKFRGYIHIHENLNHVAAEKYWSEIAGISVTNFYKTYRKPNPSSKGLRQTLPYGVFDIYIADVTLFLKIEGWTRALCSSVDE